MWMVNAVLVFAAWTAVGLVAALLFFRLGFGFEARRRDRGQASHGARPEYEPRMMVTRPHTGSPLGEARPRGLGQAGSTEHAARGRREHAEAVEATG